jgi:hypothetical protein
MRLSCVRVCVALLLFLAGTAVAGAQSFTLSGRVVDARSGQAVAHSIVELNPTGQRSTSVSTVADDEGRFSFSNLAAGKYQLSASHRGYLNQSYQQHETFSTAIAVGPDLPSQDLLFPMIPQSIIYGTITDEAGEPVRRARVRVFANSQNEGAPGRGSLPGSRQAAMTNDLGAYELAGLPPGDYYLAVSAQPWYAAGGRRIITEPPDPDTEEPQDSPLNVAYPTTFYINTTDADEATPIPLRGGERLEINLTLNPQHAMRLHLPLSQVPGASYNVTLSQTVFGVSEPVATGLQIRQAGDIIIDGVLPGQYEVTVNQFGGTPNKPSHFVADVVAGTTTLSPSELVSEVTVTGKVSGLEGKMANAGISLVSTRPRRNIYAPLDAQGEFTLQAEPGTYEVVGHIPQTYLAQVSSPNVPVHGRMLEVKSGVSPRLELVAGKGSGQIDGYVTAGNQKPGGVMVLLAPEHAAENRVLFRRDQSDSDGSFTLSNVIPGRYRLYAIDQGFDLDWTDPQVLHAFEKKSVALEVHAGEKLRQTVEVQTKQP